jgi:hypothetical protein
MSVDIQELTAEVGEDVRRHEAQRRSDSGQEPQMLQKLIRRADARRQWAQDRLQA